MKTDISKKRGSDYADCFAPTTHFKTQDCECHADERAPATVASLTSSLKPSCPVYVRDLDYGERERERERERKSAQERAIETTVSLSSDVETT